MKTLLQAEDLMKTATSDIKFLDASWHMDKTRNAKAEFGDEHILGARFFDIDEVSDKSSSLPHMLPSEERFAEEMNKMRISNSDHVVIYTGPLCFSGARAWWTFKVFGHDNVSLLDGGINAWKQAGGSVTNVPTSVSGSDKETENKVVPYVAKFNKQLVMSLDDVAAVRDSGIAQICDARSSGRFFGTAAEPRPGLVGGHIPGSLNVPFTQLLRDDDVTRFKSAEEIRDVFLAAGVIFGSKVVTTCGSGVTAAVLTLGLDLLGKPLTDSPIYE